MADDVMPQEGDLEVTEAEVAATVAQPPAAPLPPPEAVKTPNEAIDALRAWQQQHIWNSKYSQDTALVNLINIRTGELIHLLYQVP